MAKNPTTDAPYGLISALNPFARRSDEDGGDVLAMLESYPGAALLARSDGVVLAANVRGNHLKTLIEQGMASELPGLIAQSEQESTFAVGSIHLAGSNGEIILEVTVGPSSGDGVHLILTRDLTMERNLRSALVESRQRYKDLVEVSSDFSWEIGPEETFVFVSPKGALGFEANAIVGRKPDEMVANGDEFQSLPFLSRISLENVEMWMQKADGSTARVVLSCVPILGDDNQWIGARGICRDVTVQREHETALMRSRNREQLLNYIVSTVRDELEPADMLATAAEATVRALGTAGCSIYRYLADGTIVRAASAGETIETPEKILNMAKTAERSQEGHAGRWRVLAAATRYHQDVNGFICLLKGEEQEWTDDDHILIGDVANQLGIANEQITNHERILQLSRTDSMTGLLNRRAFFEEELPRRLSRMSYNHEGAAFFYIDMDNFKMVNDIHGHQVGDDAILFLRDLMEEHSRPGDVIARLGGDEFAIWLDGMPETVALERADALIADSTKLRKYSGDDAHPLGISVGIAMYDPSSGESLSDLLVRADEAMYAAKKSGKGSHFLAPKEMPDTNKG